MSRVDTLLKTSKMQGSLIPKIESYLAGLPSTDSSRAIDVNAPSAAGICMRANYYRRTGVKQDTDFLEPRTRRIFDNGSGVHERIQKYLTDSEIMLLDEVPTRNDQYNIQGHTDGLLDINNEIYVLEIKSINDRGFSELKSPKPEHVEQAGIYLFCLNKHQEEIKKMNFCTFIFSRKDREEKYKAYFKHLKDDSRHTKKEKIEYQVNLFMTADNFLFSMDKEIKKAIILYENKNDQNLKEFTINLDDFNEETLTYFERLNRHIKEEIVPEREAKSKTDCRWCNYKNECWDL